MNRFLKRFSRERLLAGAVILSLLLALLFWGMILRPRQEQIRSERRQLDELYQRVRRKDYPLDRQALEKIQAELEQVKNGSAEHPGIGLMNRKILGRAEKNCLERIRKRYGTRKDFIQRVTRLDFQEEYYAVLAEFQKMGYDLRGKKLGISGETQSPYTYQLMLQLWTLDALRQCIAGSGMKICTEQQKRRKIPLISVLPMMAYRQSYKAKEPFLLEFPVTVSLTGSFFQMQKLLDSLILEPFFLPVRHFEIFSIPPSGKQKQGSIRLNMECAGYFIWEKQ